MSTIRENDTPALTRLDQNLVLISLPTDRSLDELAAKLSPSEHEIARLAIHGATNAAIAEIRGCSHRTVANQLVSVYRKVGVSGRRELRALWARR